MNSEQLKLGILWYIVFLFSLVLHEAAHAFAGLKLGDRTAFNGGQVSLNPIPHIRREIFGTVFVPIISFFLSGWMIGWASAPMDLNWVKKNPKSSALVALAGPAANLLLVLISIFIIKFGFYAEIFSPPDSINFSNVTAASEYSLYSTAATIVSIFFSLNLILLIFNMLPLPSFDGSQIILFFANEEQTTKILQYMSNPGLSFFSLFIAWNIFEYIFDPVHLLFINLLYPGVSYH